MRGLTWSEAEVEAIVRDYFAMLEKELLGIPCNKTEHRRALSPRLDQRSDGSIERKHQNITAILIAAGFPYIRGYKPLSQYQHLLEDIVLDRIDEDDELRQLAMKFADVAVGPQSTDDILARITAPPSRLDMARIALSSSREKRRAIRVDYLAREARNRELGEKGEVFVVSYERARLSSQGLDNLADRVEHVAATRGDGLGYDVLSFAPSGRKRFIEVKTTQLGPWTPFFVSAGERAFSIAHDRDYSLYRVYEFTAHARLFALDGPIEATCELAPAQYLAVPR